MKKDIHPAYYQKAQVVCVCGNKFTIGSTVEKIEVEICSKCHPFFTGKQKFLDTSRRIEKFQEKISKSKELKTKLGVKKPKSAKKKKADKKTEKK